MKSLETIKFSEMTLGEGSINFEKRQLALYTELVKENPKNGFFKRTQLELARQLEEDEELLKANP
jgi:hypothetical protein